MRLVDELKHAGISGQLLDRADLVERSHAELTRANLPVNDAECEVTLTESGWYEWVIKGVKCEYGYSTWREAHQAGCVELRQAKSNVLRGKVTGAIIHLRALKMACSGIAGVPESLGRVIRFLEE